MGKAKPTRGAILVEDARENNLAGVSVSVPRGKVVAVAGASGSGKSTLVHRVIGRVGQRRLGRLRGVPGHLGPAYEPKVAAVDGLPACVEVRQEPLRGQPRSTVGTYTGLLDRLAWLFQHHGDAVSPGGSPVASVGRFALVEWALRHHSGALASVGRVRPELTVTSVSQLPPTGHFYVRGRDGPWEEVTRDALRPRLPTTLWVAVPDATRTLRDTQDADVIFDNATDDKLWVIDRRVYIEAGFHRLAPDDSAPYLPMTRRLFSFNSDAPGSGRCEVCDGIGEVRSVTADSLIADAALPILDGGLRLPRTGHRFTHLGALDQILRGLFRQRNLPANLTWQHAPHDVKEIILRGSGREPVPEQPLDDDRPRPAKRPFPGLVPMLLDRVAAAGPAGRAFEGLVALSPCPECCGCRYNRSARATRYRGRGLAELVQASLGELHAIVRGWVRGAFDREAEVLRGLDAVLAAYSALSLGYLNIGRATNTLSGGEAQRIRLGLGLAIELRDACYLLDEPSRALHPADAAKLNGSIRSLCDCGNTVILVEHNPVLLAEADHSIVLGPGGGTAGGHVVFEGAGPPPLETVRGSQEVRPEPARQVIAASGVCCNNVKDADFQVPLYGVTAVVGVSGAGKSSAVLRALVPAVQANLEGTSHPAVRSLRVPKSVRFVEVVSQHLLGGNRRSIVGTALAVYDDIRAYYASLAGARALSLSASDFSFNSTGACPTCDGTGVARDSFGEELDERCHACGGRRFGPVPMAVQSHGLSIADTLDTPVSALRVSGHPSLSASAVERLSLMDTLGLGHLHLGRAVPTLSAGERQRLALARFLANVEKRQGHGVLVLDEPTAGLSGPDAARVFAALAALARERSHTLVVIEHKMELLPNADWIIEFGPVGGPDGGRLVFQGTFPQLMRADTPTAVALSKTAPRDATAVPQQVRAESPVQPDSEWLNRADCFEAFVARNEVKDHTAVPHPLSPVVKLAPDRIPPDTRTHELLDMLPGLLNGASWSLPTGCAAVPSVAALATRVAGRRFGFSPVGPARRSGLAVLADLATGCKQLAQLGFRSALLGSEEVTLSQLPRRVAADNLADSWVICEDIADGAARETALRWGQGVVRILDGDDAGLVLTTHFLSDDPLPQIGMELNSRHIGDQRSPTGRCAFCKGSGRLPTYRLEHMVADQNRSLSDDAFWHPGVLPAVRALRRERLLPEAKFFTAQHVADFLLPYARMDDRTRFLFEYGVPWRRFLKPGAKRSDREQDYLAWQGIHEAVYSVLGRVEEPHKQRLKDGYRELDCPRCRGTGAGWEASRLSIGRRTLLDLLAAGSVADAVKTLAPTHRSRRVIDALDLGKLRLSARFGELQSPYTARLLAAMAALGPLSGLTLVGTYPGGKEAERIERLIRQHEMEVVCHSPPPQG